MIEQLHSYLIKELELSNKREFCYIVVSIVLFIVEIIVNFFFSESVYAFCDEPISFRDLSNFMIALSFTLLINSVLLIIIWKNNLSRKKVIATLSTIYLDHELEIYTNETPLKKSNNNIWPLVLLISITIFAILSPVLNVISMYRK